MGRVTADMGPAVVTGAAGGLGTALGSALREAGWEVVGVDLEGADHVVDVTDAAAVENLCNDLAPALWINGAGVLGAGSGIDQDIADVHRTVAVNLLGVVHGTRSAARCMRSLGRGHVITVGSLASWTPVAGEAIYAATKHAVRAYTLSVALELRATGVTLSVLCPDGIWTPMLHDRTTDASSAMSFTSARLLSAEEVARAALRLVEAPRLVASLPRRASLVARAMGLSPRFAHAVQPSLARIGRANQRRLAAAAAPAPTG